MTERRPLSPFDILRTTRALAPHDPNLNDTRWLIGEALQRIYGRAVHMPVESASFLNARSKLREAEDRVGPAMWPVLFRVVIEDRLIRECRQFVPEAVTPWRADAVVMDRLRVGLDMLGKLTGVVP